MAGRGRKPIDPAIIAAIPGVYALLHSLRRTAVRLRISEGTVQTVLAGRRTLAGAKPTLKIGRAMQGRIHAMHDRGDSQRATASECGVSKTSVHNALAALGARDPVVRDVLPYRCRGCGHRVLVDPCQICAVRAYIDRQSVTRASRSIQHLLAHGPNLPPRLET